MTWWERLNRVRDGRADYIRAKMKVEELESIATKITPSLSLAPARGCGSKDESWIKLMDYKTECEEIMRLYLESALELEKELDCINNPRIRTAMKYRFIDAKSVPDICTEMRYSESSVKKYLSTGTRIYEGVYKNEQ